MVSDPSEKGWNEDLCHPFVVILHTFYSRWIQKSLGLKNICIWRLVIGWRNMTFLSWILVVQFRPLFTRPRFFFFLIIFIVTLVCMGCHKYYRLQSLDNRHLFSRSPAGWYPRSRWLLGWFLVNPLFLIPAAQSTHPRGASDPPSRIRSLERKQLLSRDLGDSRRVPRALGWVSSKQWRHRDFRNSSLY